MDGVFQEEEHTRVGARVAFVDKHSPALQKVAMALERKVKDGVE